MATYKIPQDVEAEDKLIGPFSFRQFIFLIIAAAAAGIAFLMFRIQPLLVIIPLPIVLVFGFLGIYRRADQPVETYLLSAINFFFKPRVRVWDTEGLIENVKITAPKRMALPKLKKLGVREHSQLEQLAKIVDTRGWAVKRPELTLPNQERDSESDDRLIALDSLSSKEPIDIHDSDDILDVYNNPKAQDFTNLAASATQQVKAEAIEKMKQVAAKEPGKSAPKYAPYPSMHQKVVPPGSPDNANAILNLSKNNDLTVSQIAAQAQRQVQPNGAQSATKNTNPSATYPGGSNAAANA